MKKKHSWRRTLMIAVTAIVALIFLALIFGIVYLERALDRIDRYTEPDETLSSSQIAVLENQTEPEDQGYTGPTMDPEDVTWPTEPAQMLRTKDVIHILMIGQDRREGEGRQRSDAMILCSLDLENATLTMTSFLRDLYVQIPGYHDNRINAAYQLGGMPLLSETLKHNFGVPIDGMIEVDFNRFIQVIDVLGGVDIYLTSSEAAHLNRQKSWGLREGMNHLDGEAALAYSRIRYIGTDFGRANRQRTVLTSLVNQCRNLSVDRIMPLINTLLGLVTTDMTNKQILQYTMYTIPTLTELEIKTQYIPAEGTYQGANIRGMSVLIPDLKANRRILKNSIG